MVSIVLIAVFAVSLVCKILFTELKFRFGQYFFTPITTLSVAVLALMQVMYYGDFYSLLIALGLVVALIGDIYDLFAEHDRYYLQMGLFFFLFTHLFDISAFMPYYRFQWFHLALIPALLFGCGFSYKLFKKNLNFRFIKIMIIPYMLLVSASLFFAIGTIQKKITPKTALIVVGSALFWLSDLILGTNAFCVKIKHSTSIIWALYAPAQFCLAASCYFSF